MPSEHERDASERVKQVAQEVRDAYGGMHAWQVWFYEDPGLGFDGQTQLEARYRRARITIRPGLLAEEERRTIAHELAHVLLADIDTAVQRIIGLLKPQLADHAQDLFVDALEPVCEQLATIICSGHTSPGGAALTGAADNAKQ